ncbi:hypothetical protein Bca52824_066467 [Brassica carinata]|uniref:3-hydroxybutyryl-CoA dehydrogenase n=2 Tax=Brassica carinata TaxID=52824 RepID=A0A8X7QKR0_BRACI|nr:hypothetical protein Bca52824_066467 [Brassica carinata]
MAEIKCVGVVGAGQMGSGIAQLAATNGLDVWLMDADRDALSRATAAISSSVNRFEVGDDAMRRLRLTSNLQDLRSADIIVEAILESEDIKKKLFKDLDGIAKSSAILASNTSSISITRLASATQRPSQVIGMHFMNPPPIMKLTFIATKSLAERFGKITVCSQDYAGFIVNRILMPMINEAFHTLYTGVATKEDIDSGMKHGTNQPMGPLQLADLIGLDVCLSIMKVLHEGLGDPKYAPCPLLVQYVDAGRLGRKRGMGVYDYRKKPVTPSPRL